VGFSDSDDHVAFHRQRFHEQGAVALVPGLITDRSSARPVCARRGPSNPRSSR
jgi:hypothetical protein